MTKHVTVAGGYADFKAVLGAIGKPKSVFWWRSATNQATIAAMLENGTVVLVHVPKPDPPLPLATDPAIEPAPLPFDPAPAAPAAHVKSAAETKADHKAQAKAEADADAKIAHGEPHPSPAPKTLFEVDFPGAIELVGGAIVFS